MRGLGSLPEMENDGFFSQMREHEAMAAKAAYERERAQIGTASGGDRATLFQVHARLQEMRKRLDELAMRAEGAAEHIAGSNRNAVGEGSEKAPNVECLTDVLSADAIALGEPMQRIASALARITARIGT